MSGAPFDPESFRFSMPLELGRGFHRVRQQLVDQAMDIADELGIRFGDIDVVMVLGFRGTMRMGDLASRMVLAAPAATRIAKRLEGLGLIKRRRSEESNRVVLVDLTDPGKAMFQAILKRIHGEHETYFDEHLTPEQQNTLLDLLKRLPA
jgi:DNA-binding MarR family transcriptional regulator